MIQVSFSHLDYNVADLQKAMAFYDPLMAYLGFVKEASQPAWCLYNNKRFKLCLVECEDAFKGAGFHRKRPGLNHLAFHVEKKEKWISCIISCCRRKSRSSMADRDNFTTKSNIMPSFLKIRFA